MTSAALLLSALGLAFWGVNSLGVCFHYMDNPRERKRARLAACIGLVCIALSLLNFGVLVQLTAK